LGLTQISPLNARSWLAISSTDTATPVAKIPIAIAAAARLSLWTKAIAIGAQPACGRGRSTWPNSCLPAEVDALPARVHRIFEPLTISRCATICLSLFDAELLEPFPRHKV
jgi:hypothetical protein